MRPQPRQGQAARQSPARPPLHTQGRNCHSRHQTHGQGHTLLTNVGSERSPQCGETLGAFHVPAGRAGSAAARAPAAANTRRAPAPAATRWPRQPLRQRLQPPLPLAGSEHLTPARPALCYADWPTPRGGLTPQGDEEPANALPRGARQDGGPRAAAELVSAPPGSPHPARPA